MLKKIVFFAIIIFIIWSCSCKKEISYKLDDSKTKYTSQEGFYLPTLSKSKMEFTETEEFKKYSEKFKDYSLKKAVLGDTVTSVYYKYGKQLKLKSFDFFQGYLAAVIEKDSVKADWTDNDKNTLYFYYQTQIHYFKNKKIQSYVTWLSGNKLDDNFQIGTKYYFNEEGKLIDSLDLGKHYKIKFRDLYQMLYKMESPNNFENIHQISRYYDHSHSMWIITYNNKSSDLVIDDKTMKTYFIDYVSTKEFEASIRGIFKDFDFTYKEGKESNGILFKY